MNTSIQERLENEQEDVLRELPTLASFVDLEDRLGTPATAWLFRVRSFGWLVRRRRPDGFGPPEVHDVTRHGDVGLSLVADPEAYPFKPWLARLVTRPETTVFNPHVLAKDGPENGGVCWVDGSDGFRPGDWPAVAVLRHVLTLLTGECIQLEGFALQEDAKVWFVENASRLPFAHVPMRPGALPRGENPSPPATTGSGIEFGGDDD